MLTWIRTLLIDLDIALMRAHIDEWEDDLRRIPGTIAEYERRIVQAEAERRDLIADAEARSRLRRRRARARALT